MNNGLKKGIQNIFFANLINLVLSLVASILLPKFLSVSTYASIKTYQLYLSYALLLTLGYIDGMYLKYGGKKLLEIEKSDIIQNSSTFILIQLVCLLFAIVFGFFSKNGVLVLALYALLPVNLNNYFRVLFQATGEFYRYRKLINTASLLKFLINMLLLFAIRTDEYSNYLTGYIAVEVFVCVVVVITLRKLVGDGIPSLRFNVSELVKCVKDGFFLMLGYFVSVLLTTMDRWFVKVLLNTVAFAQYSFSVTMESFLNACVTPVSITMYNYLCNNHDCVTVNKVRRYVIVFSAFIVSAAFPAKAIIEWFLPKYTDSISTIFLLFTAQVFFVINKSVYTNLYRVFRRQRLYFLKLVTVLIVGFCLNYVFYHFYRYKESFAIATVITSVIWLFICQVDFENMHCMIREWFFLIMEASLFVIMGEFLNAVIGFFSYVTITVLLVVLLFPTEMNSICENIWKSLLRKSKE